jgi:ribosomal protection tetracycline resistance protein
MSTAADFRQLTPLVLAAALSRAGTIICEPVDRFYIEAPAESLHRVLAVLAKCGAVARDSAIVGGVARLEGTVASALIQGIQQQLPGLTGGLGTMETSFDHHAPATGPARRRQRSGADPFNASEYLLSLRRGGEGMSRNG